MSKEHIAVLNDYLARLGSCIRQQEDLQEMADRCGLCSDVAYHEGCAHGLEVAAELLRSLFGDVLDGGDADGT